MGDSSQLGSDDVVAFVDASKQDVAEMNRPDSVIDFLETEISLVEKVGEQNYLQTQIGEGKESS